ncbi:MAG: alpha-galactosidase [Bacteroidales bacterium]|nr:alpha-galactosidase [Bacteroidales bacterium]
MKYSLLFAALLMLTFTTIAQDGKTIHVGTRHTDLIFKVGNDGRLYKAYLGTKLSDNTAFATSRTPGHLAYITAGTDNLFEPAIRVTHTDGNPSLELKYVSHTTDNLTANITHTRIVLKDDEYPVEIILHLKSHAAEDVFEQWTEIIHHEKKPIILYNYASSMLHFDAPHYWLTQFHGDWAEEMKLQEAELTSGIKIIDSKLGSRAHMYQTPVFFLSLNNKSTENTGELIAGTLGWSGNFRFLFEIDERNSLRMIAGINPYASEYTLAPDKPFITPSFIFTHSSQGKGLASRNLHRWAINTGVMDGTAQRLTLLNNWETTYFDFNEEKLMAMLDDTKKMGLDMFLLDDGWFANKYPRNNDRAGLGDWEENKAKLPNGLGVLTSEAEKHGVKFGLWIEPEMVNPKSELYEMHPDWILKLPNRPEHYYRNQLVLDLTNPEVQDFVFNLVDGLLTKYPGIAYFKWDCNRMMTNTYSTYLKDKQSHVYVDYVNGLYKVLDRIRQKYPHVPMMLCSGGGGRVDYGALRYFTEFWASDNTDPVERVYMQWGYSFFFPAVATCNHVTSWGKQTLKFRTDVAMMGKLGYDLRVNELDEKELAFSQQAVENYSRLSDIIWHGDLYRLISPYDENRAVAMYVSENKDKAVLFSYTLNARFGENFNAVRLQGLDPAKQYEVKEINSFPGIRGLFMQTTRYSGDYLMKEGLRVSNDMPLSSAVIEITAQ